MITKIVTIIVTLMFSLLTTSVSADITLARAPQLSTTQTAEIWAPYVEYLSEALGEKVVLKFYSKREKFEADISNEKVDMYFGNPAYAVVGKLCKGYIPLIRGDKKRLRGIIVVRKDSEFKTVEDLQNQTIVFPSKTAFAASLYIRDQLTNVVKLKYKEEFVGTHDNAYRAVLIGKYAATGGVRRTLALEPKELQEKLRIIYETPGVKSHALVIHPRVPQDIREKIVQATINLEKFVDGRKMLESLEIPQPVRVDYDKDYKQLEELASKVYDYLL